MSKKRYVLKQQYHTPEVFLPVGTASEPSIVKGFHLFKAGYKFKEFHENYMDSNKDFFAVEEIKEPERIEVEVVSDWCHNSWLTIKAKNEIPSSKFPEIKSAIERVLNDEEGKYDAPPLSKYLADEVGQWDSNPKPLKFAKPKKFTEDDVKDAMGWAVGQYAKKLETNARIDQERKYGSHFDVDQWQKSRCKENT